MTLKEKITHDLTEAMKAKDELTLGTLRMVKAAIMKFEVAGTAKVEAANDAVVALLKKEVKMRQEAAEGFEKGGNSAAAEKERAEMKVIQKYLPEAMGEEAVRAAVQKIVADLKPAGPQDFGKVMGAVMKELKGKADGGLVNRVVKACL